MLKSNPRLDLAVLKTSALEEISRKPLETLTLVGGVLSVVVLGLLNLMVSRYLAVFGQPGLPAFGDGGSLLAGLVLTTLAVIFGGLIFISVPIFAALGRKALVSTCCPMRSAGTTSAGPDASARSRPMRPYTARCSLAACGSARRCLEWGGRHQAGFGRLCRPA